MNGKILTSEAEKTGYKFELQDNYSGGMIFKVLPKFKLRQIGDPIQYIDKIVVLNIKLNCFINFSADSAAEIEKTVEGEFKNPYQNVEYRVNNKLSQK